MDTGMYLWLDGTTQFDYADWATGYPSNSKKHCVTWGFNHKMKDHSCFTRDRASICEIRLPNGK